MISLPGAALFADTIALASLVRVAKYWSDANRSIGSDKRVCDGKILSLLADII